MEADGVEQSRQHKAIINRKGFLRAFYREIYGFFKEHAEPLGTSAIVELGSGGGFCPEVFPQVICTDLVILPGVSVVCSARNLPFGNESLSAILALNVFHHLNDCEAFLTEASRCLQSGGKILMVEPHNCLWSSLIYKNVHHEPFDEKQCDWKLPGQSDEGRLTIANGALPWIVFFRDRARLDALFPNLRVDLYEPCFPFTYLLSGGLSAPSLLPAVAYPMVRAIEKLLLLDRHLGMFTKIVVTKR